MSTPQGGSPVHDPSETLARKLGELLDLLADRLANRMLVLLEQRTDARALTLATLDLDTLRNMLDVAGDAPVLAKARELAARVAEELHSATRGGAR